MNRQCEPFAVVADSPTVTGSSPVQHQCVFNRCSFNSRTETAELRQLGFTSYCCRLVKWPNQQRDGFTEFSRGIQTLVLSDRYHWKVMLFGDTIDFPTFWLENEARCSVLLQAHSLQGKGQSSGKEIGFWVWVFLLSCKPYVYKDVNI